MKRKNSMKDVGGRFRRKTVLVERGRHIKLTAQPSLAAIDYHGIDDCNSSGYSSSQQRRMRAVGDDISSIQQSNIYLGSGRRENKSASSTDPEQLFEIPYHDDNRGSFVTKKKIAINAGSKSMLTLPQTVRSQETRVNTAGNELFKRKQIATIPTYALANQATKIDFNLKHDQLRAKFSN